jgi:hypothetical protein
LSRFVFNANFKTDGEPKKIDDFLIFKDQDEADIFPPEAAAAALDLRARVPSQCPKIIEGIWPSIIKSVGQNKIPVKIKAMKSRCGRLWILAPKITGGRVSGVVAVTGGLSGVVNIYDIDRRFYSVTVALKPRREASYVAEAVLELAESQNPNDLRPTSLQGKHF